MLKNKNKIIPHAPFIKGALTADKPSPFVIDLKKQLAEREADCHCEERNRAKRSEATKQSQGAAETLKLKTRFFCSQGLLRSAEAASLAMTKKLCYAIQNSFNIFKKILKPFYRIFYKIGWIFLFIVRFFYFAVLIPVKFVFKKVKLFFLNVIPAEAGIQGLVDTTIFLDPLVSARGGSAFGGKPEDDKKKILGNRKILPAHIHPVGMPIIKAEFSKKEIDEILNDVLRKNHGVEKNSLNKKHDQSKQFLATLEMTNTPRFSAGLLKPVFVFAVILLVLILPFKALTFYRSLNLDQLRGRVLGASADALNNLFSAGNAASDFNFTGAKKDFSRASENFLKAQDELSQINDLLFSLASLAPNEELKLAGESKKILAAGRIAAELGSNLSEAAETLLSAGGSGKNFGDVLKKISEAGAMAADNARDLNNIIKEINEDNLPEEYRGRFAATKEQAVFLENGLNEFVDLVKYLRIILGGEEDKRYLFVFQNNAEARPTGGFIGSYALVDFKNGKIKNIEVPGGGSYDTRAGLRRLVEAPEPFHLVDPLWHFWDANWWPDWPTSARKLEWFYEKSGGPTVDGIISLTPTVTKRLLEITGPADMTEKYGVLVTAENFWETTRGIIEKSNAIPGKKNKSVSTVENADGKPAYERSADSAGGPKKIIGDLTAKILDELPKRLDKNNIIKLLEIADRSLSEKHILLYFNDNELEKIAGKYGWDGGIKKTSKDYLSVVNTNIGGGKSDRKVKEIIYHEAEVMPDGSIINTVKIERFHDSLKFVDSSGVRNVNWLRVYVPLGSKLIEASGFEKPSEIYFSKPEAIYEKDPDIARAEQSAITDEKTGVKIYVESGKTVFANWSMVDPGGTAIIYLKYQLPFKLTSEKETGLFDKIADIFKAEEKDTFTYSLLAQKQSGGFNPSKIYSKLKLPAGMKISWNYPENAANSFGWEIEDYLDVDKYWATIIEN